MSIILSISFTIFASVSLYLHTCLYRLPVSTEQSKREESEREREGVTGCCLQGKWGERESVRFFVKNKREEV